jgi:hypothetical protein
MTSTYTPLGVELMVTGENAGTWGTKTNTNLNIIEQISGGYAVQTLNAAGSGANTTALAVSDGSTGATLATRVIILGAESPQAITGAKIVTVPNDVENWYLVKNSTSGAYTVQFKTATGSGDTVTWSTTDKGFKLIYVDGAGSNPSVIDVFATFSGITLNNNNPLTLNDADNNAYVKIDVPTAVSGSYTLTLPAAVGAAADYALTTSDGSGNTQWTATSTFGITTGKAIAMAMIFG